MYSFLLGAVLSALTLGSVSASAVVSRSADKYGFPSNVKQHFYLVGNGTGIAKVDGAKLEAQNKASTYTGFNLPYGESPTVFGYDPNSAYLYSGTTSSGKPLILGAFAQSDGTAAIKPATSGQKGQSPIECVIIDSALLCSVIVNGVNYNKLLAQNYNKDGNYELGIGPAHLTVVQLNIAKAS